MARTALFKLQHSKLTSARAWSAPFLGALVVLGYACTPNESANQSAPVASTCNARMGEACVGTPAVLCAGDPCVDPSLQCTKVVTASSETELGYVLSTGANEGACVALTPGSYGPVVLPAGMHLLGRGASLVKLAKLTLSRGSMARGVTVTGGIVVENPRGASLDAIVVEGSPTDGISVSGGDALRMSRVEIKNAGRHGLFALDAGAIRFDNSVVSGAKGPGIWAECAGGCACGVAEASLALNNVVLRENRVIGLSLIGVRADLDGVDVLDNPVGDDFAGSGGISASNCALLSAKHTRVLNNSSYGVLIDGASATLGAEDQPGGIEIGDNLMGLWVQNLAFGGKQPVVVANAKVTHNAGVGIGLLGGQSEVRVVSSEVSSTVSKIIPTIQNGEPRKREVGHGFAWMGKAHAKLEKITLRSNATASLLIDGEVAQESSVVSVTLEGGDEQKGIVQQNLPEGGKPVESLPAPQRVTQQRFALPQAPMVPSKITR